MLLTLMVVSVLGYGMGMVISVLLFAAAVVLALIGIIRKISNNQKGFVLQVIVLLMCSVFALNFAFQLKSNKTLAVRYDDVEGYAKGIVADIPGYDGTYRYVIRCDDGFEFLLNTSENMGVNLYDEFEGTVTFCTSAERTTELPVQAYGRLGEISFRSANQRGIKSVVYDIRQKAAKFIENHMPHQTAALVKGVLLGDETSFTPYLEQDFTITGLAHLLVISGSHLSMFVTVMLLFLPLGINRRRLAWTLIIPMIFYMMICGMGASVVRAGICSGIFVLSYTLKRDVAPVNSLGFAAMSVCMFWPQGAVSLGFLLSFYSTLGAILFYHPVNNMVQNTKLPKLIKIILKPIVLTSSAQLFITPIMVVCYGKLTPIAILSNVVVGGLVGLIMCASAVGLILSAFVIAGPLSHLFCFVADKLSDFCLMWVEILSGFTNAEITVSKSETVFAILLLCTGVMMFMLSKGKKPPTIIGLSCVSLALVLICLFSFLASERVTVNLVSEECVAISYKGCTVSVGDCTSRKGDLRLERAVYASTDSVDLLDLHSLDQYSASISASSRQAKCVLMPKGAKPPNVPYIEVVDQTKVAISDDCVVTAGKGYTCVYIGGERIVIAKKDADITQIKNVDYLIVEVDFNYDDKTWEVYEKANGLAIKDGKVYNVIGNNTYFSIDRFFGIIL